MSCCAFSTCQVESRSEGGSTWDRPPSLPFPFPSSHSSLSFELWTSYSGSRDLWELLLLGKRNSVSRCLFCLCVYTLVLAYCLVLSFFSCFFLHQPVLMGCTLVGSYPCLWVLLVLVFCFQCFLFVSPPPLPPTHTLSPPPTNLPSNYSNRKLVRLMDVPVVGSYPCLWVLLVLMFCFRFAFCLLFVSDTPFSPLPPHPPPNYSNHKPVRLNGFAPCVFVPLSLGIASPCVLFSFCFLFVSDPPPPFPPPTPTPHPTIRIISSFVLMDLPPAGSYIFAYYLCLCFSVLFYSCFFFLFCPPLFRPWGRPNGFAPFVGWIKCCSTELKFAVGWLIT